MKAYQSFCQQGEEESKSGWYTSSKCQEPYQKYVKTLISRYINSTAIFAWELANEPRCGGCNTTVITEWARKTSKYIKSLAPSHMVAVGDEGFGLRAPPSNPDADSYPNTFNEGTDFAQLVSLPDIDFGTFHLYPDHCKYLCSSMRRYRSNSRREHHFEMGERLDPTARSGLHCCKEAMSL